MLNWIQKETVLWWGIGAQDHITNGVAPIQIGRGGEVFYPINSLKNELGQGQTVAV